MIGIRWDCDMQDDSSSSSVTSTATHDHSTNIAIPQTIPNLILGDATVNCNSVVSSSNSFTLPALLPSFDVTVAWTTSWWTGTCTKNVASRSLLQGRVFVFCANAIIGIGTINGKSLRDDYYCCGCRNRYRIFIKPCAFRVVHFHWFTERSVLLVLGKDLLVVVSIWSATKDKVMGGGNFLSLAFLMGTKTLVRYTITFIHLHHNIIIIIIRIPSIIELVKFISHDRCGRKRGRDFCFWLYVKVGNTVVIVWLLLLTISHSWCHINKNHFRIRN